MIGSKPLSPPNESVLDEDLVDAIDAQQTNTIYTPEMQERVRGRLMHRIEQDVLLRPAAAKLEDAQ